MISTEQLFRRYYTSIPGYQDGTAFFHSLVAQCVPYGTRILEIGAGPTNNTTAFLRSRGSVVGLDVSSEVTQNSYLDEARVFDGATFPFSDCSFDACCSNYVLEHVPNPEEHFKEVFRVLKPGGAYCFRTPNRWHYIGLCSSLLPHRAHLMLANRLRNLADTAHDPYPTTYMANTKGRLQRLCRDAGFWDTHILMVEKEPFYGRRYQLLFWPMMFYERIVNSSDIFGPLRVNIFGRSQKSP
jgi:SAM-dependent methyltransferase